MTFLVVKEEWPRMMAHEKASLAFSIHALVASSSVLPSAMMLVYGQNERNEVGSSRSSRGSKCSWNLRTERSPAPAPVAAVVLVGMTVFVGVGVREAEEGMAEEEGFICSRRRRTEGMEVRSSMMLLLRCPTMLFLLLLGVFLNEVVWCW